jgi:hypothetical protein
MVIDMGNDNTLITVAMLSALRSQKKNDYIDLLTPFVINILPKEINTLVNGKNIQDKLNEYFGLSQIPLNVIELIFKRCQKKGMLKWENKKYYVEKIDYQKDFETNKLKYKDFIEKVVISFSESLRERFNFKSITLEQAKIMLLSFFNDFGYAIYADDTSVLRALTITRDSNNYIVAQFILDEREKESIVFNALCEIITGFFIYKAIYYFGDNIETKINSKFKHTVFYFDTPLLISALGIDTDTGEQAVTELIEMIYENNGSVKTFEHYVDEVKGILKKYANDILARTSLTLENFIKQGYDSDNAMRFCDSLEIKLKKIKIKTEEGFSYGYIDSKNLKSQGHLDLVEFKETMISHIRNNLEIKNKRIDNDVESISIISRIRKDFKQYKLDDCKAVLSVIPGNILSTKH